MTTTDPRPGSTGTTPPRTGTTTHKGGGAGAASGPPEPPARTMPREVLMLAAPAALATVAGTYTVLGPVGGTIATGTAAVTGAGVHVVRRRRRAAAAAKASGKTPKTPRDLRREARHQRRTARASTRLGRMTARARNTVARRLPPGRLRNALTPAARRLSGNGRPGSIASRAGRGNGRGTLLGRSNGRGVVPGNKRRGTSLVPGSRRQTNAPGKTTGHRNPVGGLRGRRAGAGGPGRTGGRGGRRNPFTPGNASGGRRRPPTGRTSTTSGGTRRGATGGRGGGRGGYTGTRGNGGRRSRTGRPPRNYAAEDAAWIRHVEERDRWKTKRKADKAARKARNKAKKINSDTSGDAPQPSPDPHDRRRRWRDRWRKPQPDTHDDGPDQDLPVSPEFQAAREAHRRQQAQHQRDYDRMQEYLDGKLNNRHKGDTHGTSDGGTIPTDGTADGGTIPTTAGETPNSDPRGGTMTDDSNYRDDVSSAVNADVENATQALEMVDRMAAQSEDLAATTSATHDLLTERVRWNSDVADGFHNFSHVSRLNAEAHREFQSQIHTSHANDIERIKSGTEADAAWDVSKNR